MSLTKFTQEALDYNTLAEKEWTCPRKGLRKELIALNFLSMTKPTEISKCLLIVSDVQNLSSRESNYLSKSEEFWVELGSAITPVDVYFEILLQQMFTGETSRCFIKTKSGEEISFTVRMIKIEFEGYLFKLNVRQMYDLANRFKENGVAMFKKYPLFAQEYFTRAAKCLISYKPFDVLSLKSDGVDPNDLENLLQTLQLNIAACQIKQGRFEDVLYLTQFVESVENPSKKAIYRRAVAYYNLKKFDEAKTTIEKVDYKDKPEFSALYSKVLNDWKSDNERYNCMVRKMFG